MTWPWARQDDEQRLEKAIEDTVRRTMRAAIDDTSSVLNRMGEVSKLREDIEALKMEKARREEEFTRREREVEHKVGLERKRQEFEIQQSKREATVTVREENLKADRARFEEQMKFHDDRFSQEVGYLKDMLADMLKRLPSAEILIERKAGR